MCHRWGGGDVGRFQFMCSKMCFPGSKKEKNMSQTKAGELGVTHSSEVKSPDSEQVLVLRKKKRS